MAQFFFSRNIGDGKTLCLAPLTERLRRCCAEEICDDSGYFLFERRRVGENEDIDIIARVSTDEAALRLSAIMGLE